MKNTRSKRTREHSESGAFKYFSLLKLLVVFRIHWNFPGPVEEYRTCGRARRISNNVIIFLCIQHGLYSTGLSWIYGNCVWILFGLPKRGTLEARIGFVWRCVFSLFIVFLRSVNRKILPEEVVTLPKTNFEQYIIWYYYGSPYAYVSVCVLTHVYIQVEGERTNLKGSLVHGAGDFNFFVPLYNHINCDDCGLLARTIRGPAGSVSYALDNVSRS